MIVRELMTRNPVSVPPDASLTTAVALLDEHDITALPVVDGDGRLCGILSEADLIRELVGATPGWTSRGTTEPDRQRCVGELMSRHVLTVREETDVAFAVEVATSTAAKTLPVVDDRGRVVGMLSRRDVVHVLARPDELLEQEVDALFVALGQRDWLVDVRDGVAEVSGPTGTRERVLAEAVARGVPGVVEVRIV